MAEAYLMNHSRKKEQVYGYYGVKIDTANSNSESAVTYIGDSIGMTPANGNNGSFSYGSWSNVFPFNEIKPCVFKGGVVQYYLNPNNYSKKLDGTNADITSGADGDVMVEFPKVYWKFEKIGSDITIKYSDTKLDDGFKCWAHLKGDAEVSKVYIGAYLGFEVSSAIRSLSGKTPTANKRIAAARTSAKVNGSSYNLSTYYQTLMLQVLYLVMFKDRNSQSALGQGYTASTTTASITTGNTNDKGLFYGESTGKSQMKFCGIEDWYGNLLYWIDGLCSDVNYNMLIGHDNYNDTGTGYVNYGVGASLNLNGYMSEIQGGTETGFILKVANGSLTTYYADSPYFYSNSSTVFGGSYGMDKVVGAFYIRIGYGANGTPGSRVGYRLSAFAV